MRRFGRWFLFGVLGLDVLFVVIVINGGIVSVGAEPPAAAAVDSQAQPAEQATVWTREALDALGRELRLHGEQLDQRERELEEQLRGGELLGRQAALEPATAPEAATATPSKNSGEKQNDAFLRLQRAFENMEPDSAAQALAELARKDKDAVVALVLGWPPRTSGAILDALTQQNPVLAAELSYSIWSMNGKDEPAVAGSGR